MTILGLFQNHKNRCTKNDCLCKIPLQKETIDTISGLNMNLQIYAEKANVPLNYREGLTEKALKILIEEQISRHEKADKLIILSAEVSFYYLANHYNALEQIFNLESRKPSLLLQQRIYNLRRSISIGMTLNNDYYVDPECIIDSIQYMRYYHHFLEEVENARDLTIRFWTIIVQDAPSAVQLNDMGKCLFKKKYKIMNTVQKISDINANSTEFLIRYGLFMKFIIHDSVAADQVFKKILLLADSSNYNSLCNSVFSVFRGDSTIMFLLASLDKASESNIIDINTELEQGLNYLREDLIGHSITCIMPPIIAQKHSEYIHNFYLTMNKKSLNTPRLRFVKSKSGVYVPCLVLKKIVPNLNEGFRVVLFMRADNKFSHYTYAKKALTCKKAGAILCDTNNSIIGATKNAYELLKNSGDGLQILFKGIVIQDLFPILSESNCFNELMSKRGAIFKNLNCKILLDYLDDDLRKKEICNQQELADTLYWGIFIHEVYGDTDTCNIFIFSEILKSEYTKYKGN